MNNTRLWMIGLLVAWSCAGLAGCASKKPEPWVPAPYVHWQNVSPVTVSALENGYRIIVDQPTTGLFPASIAVTRVGLVTVNHDPHRFVPVIYKDPKNEFLQWNSSFDDQMAVSEVFPVDQFDLGGGLAEPEQVLAAFRGLNANLGLIYAMNELAPDQSEMFGTLYDVDNFRPIAYLHASARSERPPDPECDEVEAEKEEAINLWMTDSRALVRREFEHVLYACVYELIQQDQAEVTDVPEGWKRVHPEQPVVWPPRPPAPGESW